MLCIKILYKSIDILFQSFTKVCIFFEILKIFVKFAGSNGCHCFKFQPSEICHIFHSFSFPTVCFLANFQLYTNIAEVDFNKKLGHIKYFIVHYIF